MLQFVTFYLIDFPFYPTISTNHGRNRQVLKALRVRSFLRRRALSDPFSEMKWDWGYKNNGRIFTNWYYIVVSLSRSDYQRKYTAQLFSRQVRGQRSFSLMALNTKACE